MNMLFRTTDAVEMVSAGDAETPVGFCAAVHEGQGQQDLDCLLRVLLEDRDAPVLEKIGTLCEARDIVRSEMARLAQGQLLDRSALRQLGTSVHNLAEQAEILILTMIRRGNAAILVSLVDEIFDSFRDAERLIEIALRRGRL